MKEKPRGDTRNIDLGLDPRDPWAFIPAERRDDLQASLVEMARIRRQALDNSKHLPLP